MTIKPVDTWTRTAKDAARAILLEVSPWSADGGELIGRDPRKVPAEQLNRAGLEGHPLLVVIKAKCMQTVRKLPEFGVKHRAKSER